MIFLVLFIVFRNDYFNKYLQGIHLWQMGYEFSNFIGIHAAALNMYVSFISIILLYNFLNEYVLNSFSRKSFFLIALFLLSFLFASCMDNVEDLFNNGTLEPNSSSVSNNENQNDCQ